MTSNTSHPSKLDSVLAEQKQYIESREQSYREQALKLYPWTCGHCARDFVRKNLRELTVHHVDHNHDNNPSDGSNWELLCIYCHDEEHTKFENLIRYGSVDEAGTEAQTFQPFANLKQKMKDS